MSESEEYKKELAALEKQLKSELSGLIIGGGIAVLLWTMFMVWALLYSNGSCK